MKNGDLLLLSALQLQICLFVDFLNMFNVL